MKKPLVVAISALAWTFVGMTCLWYLLVLGSGIYDSCFIPTPYIPEMIANTQSTVRLILLWTLAVGVLSLSWVTYNRHRFKPAGSPEVEPVPLVDMPRARDIPWSEAVVTKLDAKHILTEAGNVLSNLSIIRLHAPAQALQPELMEPHRLFNQAVSLMKKDKYSSAVSLLRKLLSHPGSSPILKRMAEWKLAECLHTWGFEEVAAGLAEQAANSIRGGRAYAA